MEPLAPAIFMRYFSDNHLTLPPRRYYSLFGVGAQGLRKTDSF
jgi:hypothetical protein